MAEKRERDWLDLIAKLLLPVVIAGGGFWFTMHEDGIKATQEKNDHTTDVARQQLERDTGYIRMLVSTNEKERELGLKIIEGRQQHGDFSQDLVPVLLPFYNGRPSAQSTQTARGILKTAATQNQEIKKKIDEQPSNTEPTVYLQIAREEQRAEAVKLQDQLTKANFTVEDIDLPKGPTVNTYVRYFSEGGKENADKILAIMKTMGFNVEEQFVHGNQAPPNQLEVWIGQRQPLLSKQ